MIHMYTSVENCCWCVTWHSLSQKTPHLCTSLGNTMRSFPGLTSGYSVPAQYSYGCLLWVLRMKEVMFVNWTSLAVWWSQRSSVANMSELNVSFIYSYKTKTYLGPPWPSGLNGIQLQITVPLIVWVQISLGTDPRFKKSLSVLLLKGQSGFFSRHLWIFFQHPFTFLSSILHV